MTHRLPVAPWPQQGEAQMPASLFDRLGGKAAITAVVLDFRKRVEKDARINAKFARTDIPRLDAMLIDQVCEATGGPCRYSGRSMRDAHQGMRVTTGEFNALVEDLVATLNGFKVGKAEQDELLGILGPLKPDIVEVESDATATPLPDAYREAPPLARA
jgi:hemoglobin